MLLRSFCTPEQIEGLHFTAPASSLQGQYRPVVTKKKRLVQTAAQRDVNVTLAFRKDGEIVGLGILEYPGPEDRWIKVGDRVMMEVSIIEVRRPWRRSGLARNVLRLTLDHPMVETRICYMVGYSWTWDLDAHGGTAMDYRNTLIDLFSREGFKIFQTNEPNVMLRPENLFMARVGKAVSKETADRFKLARFNLL
ncbi:MAG: N-acetyltransferase [Candidatus Desulfacyla sp.]